MTWVLWLLGYPDQALQKTYAALTLAQELAHPFSQALALFFAIVPYLFRQEAQAAQGRTEVAITYSKDQGFPFWSAIGTAARGWVLAEHGRLTEGIEQMRQGIAAFQATGAQIGQTHYLAGLAEVYGKVGQVEEALSTIAEALTMARTNGEGYYEAELYRLKGEILQKRKKKNLKTTVAAEVEECFLKAAEIARRQSAKSWELRATTSLARLWQRQGKRHEARTMLAAVYNWFTEGFATKDLQEAKALLEELR